MPRATLPPPVLAITARGKAKAKGSAKAKGKAKGKPKAKAIADGRPQLVPHKDATDGASNQGCTL